jgi:hypothetical protein
MDSVTHPNSYAGMGSGTGGAGDGSGSGSGAGGCGSGFGMGVGITSGPPALGTSSGSNIKNPHRNLEVMLHRWARGHERLACRRVVELFALVPKSTGEICDS